MNVITTPVQPLQTELSSVIGRLMTEALAEANAAVERACAASQSALEAAKVALEEQIRRNVALSASLLESECEVEDLRVKLQAERDNTKAAIDAHATTQRAHAEMLNEHGIREQLVAAYEVRLRDVNAEFDAMRASMISLKQQREVEAADHARLIAAFKTVQQTCALVEFQTNRQADSGPADERHEVMPHTQEQPSTRPIDDCAVETPEAAVAAQTRDDETPLPTSPAARRSLMLVAPSEAPAVAASPQLVEYLQGLFEQIAATYFVDVQAHAMADVLDLLSTNVRCARSAFVQRASVEGVNGAELFEQQLSAKLDEFGATPLGRHLSIAAYELIHAEQASAHAKAS